MRKAGKEARKFVILIGEDEIKGGNVLLKNMEDGTQETVTFEEAMKKLKG
jgi:histidyl-tRNA synthetase